MSRSIFIDRDGILNELVYYKDTAEWESPRQAEDFKIIPGAVEVLKELQKKGWPLILVSNQPSCAKGKTSLGDLKAIHNELENQLGQHGVQFQDVFYCYHHPNGSVPEWTVACDCRKPSIGSLLRAQQRHSLDLTQCWFIGDQDTDVFCGQRAGCKTIQLNYGPSQSKRGSSTPVYTCDNLQEVTSIICLASE